MERNKVIVRSVGSPTCKVALIGQAPADQEIKHSPPTPFVGAAGEILNDRIESAGLRRSWFYITNVVKEQPPDNDITHFIQKTRRGIVTTPAWDAYVKALHVELSMTKANVLIPLGNEALYALTGKWGITKWRGSILECPYVPNLSGTGGRKVIPTIHPAAVLESGIYLYNHYITRDLQFAYSEADVPDLNLPRRHIRVDPTFVGAERYLKDIIESCALVAFDIEVLRDELSCIAFARSPTDCMVINFTRSGRPSFTPTDELHIMRLIARILEDDGIKKVGPAGLNAFLQGLDNKTYTYNTSWLTKDITEEYNVLVHFTADAYYRSNYYGIYPSPYQSASRALPEWLENSYHLTIEADVFEPVNGYHAAATFKHNSGGALVAIGLTRTPDIRIAALALLMYYRPVIYKETFTAPGKSRLVILQLGEMGGV